MLFCNSDSTAIYNQVTGKIPGACLMFYMPPVTQQVVTGSDEQSVTPEKKLTEEDWDAAKMLANLRFIDCPGFLDTPTTLPRETNSEQALFQTSSSRPPALKYVLPSNLEGREYYICTVCHEKRDQNSFFFGHAHGEKKPRIKWYCPICNKHFSTSYRSGHLRKAHGFKIARPSSAAASRKRDSLGLGESETVFPETSSEMDDIAEETL